MKSSYIKLQKFFKLEAERGYDNHAVLGGLDRILDFWVSEARTEGISEDLIQIISARLHDYPRLTPQSRSEVLDGLWRRVQRETGGSHAPEVEQTPETKPKNIEASQESEPPDEGEAGPAEDETEALTEETQEEISALVEVEKPQRRAPERQRPEGPPIALDAPVTVLPGVGRNHARTLSRLGLTTIRDMLFYFPRRYDDFSLMKPINRLIYGDQVTIIGTVQSFKLRPTKSRKSLVEAIVSDGSAAVRLNWFNQEHMIKRLREGAQVSVSGKVDQYLGRLVFNNPNLEFLEQQQLSANRIWPNYSIKTNISQKWLRKLMEDAILAWAPHVRDPLPEWILQQANLMDLAMALQQVHVPDSWEDLKAAQHRLAFDEIFYLQLGVLSQKRAWQQRQARVFTVEDGWLDAQTGRLPYTLTGAQRHALKDLRHDLAAGQPMNRLIQGDVGSGKTVVAALGISIVVQQGAQVALMAPTSILAEQHYKNLLKLLSEPVEAILQSAEANPASQTEGAQEPSWVEERGPQPDQPAPQPPPLQPEQIRLMLGATPEAEKQEIRDGLADGSIKVVVGTHALIEEPVSFKDLQLAIIDEQHRFGVEQRAALRSKGDNPHLLVMTATPIPRSLALTVYGDLDLTVMDEMPPGRKPVGTYVLLPLERERAFNLIRSQVELGRQAFVIYPLIEESENSEAKAAVEEFSFLQETVFPHFKVGLLHGRMRPEEKEEAMRRFRDGETQILASTTVIEVGVDVPNATVMLIEGANRFGLAQLHQLRGRVGRGADKSFCILIPDSADTAENERLQVMTETNDGFVLAERDLEQRGPGQFLGTRQSGFAELQMANLSDVRLIEKARMQAQALFDQYPELDQAELQPLLAEVQHFWSGGQGDIS
jgi:ATP-dependent DNA helicase RecG